MKQFLLIYQTLQSPDTHIHKEREREKIYKMNCDKRIIFDSFVEKYFRSLFRPS